jgi:competence protein ComEC
MAGNPPSNFESLSRKLHEPLIPPLVAVISGILFVRVLGFDPTLALVCSTLSALLWFLATKLHHPRAAFLSGNAILFWLAIASASRTDNKPKPVIDTDSREVISLEGCVDSLPQREAERLFFTFTAAPGARLRVSLYLKPEESAPDWAYGHRLQLPLRIRPVHNSGNPGNFDAERYFAHREIYWSASIAKGYPIIQVPNACGNPVQAAIYKTRAWLLTRIEQIATGDRYLTAMLGALLLGDNAKLEDSFTDNYRRTGTYHAIVISGIHITVLAGSLFWLLRLLHFRPLQAYALCAILAVLYAVICDLTAPVVRAAGGYLLFLAARHFYRRGRILNLLAAVAIAYLLFDPAQLFEASFQLSFLAVLTLATLGLPLIENTTGLWSKALRKLSDPDYGDADPRTAPRRLEIQLALQTISRITHIPLKPLSQVTSHILASILWALDLFLTSAVVLIGLCLPTILFFHRLTFSSLTANLPVVFLLSLAVPLGFIAIFTGPMLTPLLKWLLNTSRTVVDWHLTWDPGDRIPDPPTWILIALPLALLTTAWAARKVPRYTAIPVAAVLALFAYLVTHPYSKTPNLNKNLLELTAIDVGQGDGLFLATPSGHLALLDAGGNRSTKFDTGESTVSPYLWSRHISKLHTLIASHGDLDHMGGLLAAHDNFRPDEIWVSAQVSGPLWDQLKAKATAKNTTIRYLAKGDRLKLGGLEVQTLWPPSDEQIDKSNLTSLVLLLHYGNQRFLLTGDIDQSIEARLLEDPNLPKLDYLKVAHHGSKTSSSEPFLAQTRPSLAVVSAGYQNNFNHPNPAVLHRLNQSRTLLLRTDRMGQITVLADGKKLTTDPFIYRSPSSLGWIPFTQALE